MKSKKIIALNENLKLQLYWKCYFQLPRDVHSDAPIFYVLTIIMFVYIIR